MREAQHTGDNFEMKLSPLCCTTPRQQKKHPCKRRKNNAEKKEENTIKLIKMN